MKLRNKKTGEIGYTAVLRSKAIVVMDENAIQLASYTSLAKLNEEWEDAPKEPKDYWYICTTRNYEITRVVIDDGTDFDRLQKDKEMGNYFETLEEAEKAVEKLMAWKRLKDKGFRFIDHTDFDDGNITIWGKFNKELDGEDVHLLFGGEE